MRVESYMNTNTIDHIQTSRIAILIPCYNEAATIAGVIEEFRSTLPSAEIYVYDNNSNDGTDRIAQSAGAIVRYELRQGKGYVVRRMFQEVDADIYIMVDGDETYSSSEVHELIKPLLTHRAHMVVGTRLAEYQAGSFRSMHRFGNSFITKIINFLFKSSLTDVLSGYRVYSRTFVKGVPLASKGFEIEIEMTLNALDSGLNILEIPIVYSKRPEGSQSKLSTYRDGLLILATILSIFRDYRPLLFFSTISLIFLLFGFYLGVPVILEFAQTGLVERFPTAILAASLEIMAFQMIGVGLVLDTMARQRRYQQEQWLRETSK
jgi:glycosyltransferase involved in cell wall biosynthesis